MRHHLMRTFTGLALAGALLGPAVGHAVEAGRAPADETTVAFVNDSMDQAIVYAIDQGGMRYRVGTVAPGRTERLRLPAGLASTATSVQFVARPLAGNRLATTGPLTIRPGDTLTITLPPMQNTLGVLPGLP